MLDLGEQSIEVPWSDPRAVGLAALHTARVTVGLRPEALALVPAGTHGAVHDHVDQWSTWATSPLWSSTSAGYPQRSR